MNWIFRGFWVVLGIILWIFDLVSVIYGSVTRVFCDFPRFCPHFLRDETGVGRGVHRFWGVPIQKSRSNFSPFSHFSPDSGISGVGVVYSGISRGVGGI